MEDSNNTKWIGYLLLITFFFSILFGLYKMGITYHPTSHSGSTGIEQAEDLHESAPGH